MFLDEILIIILSYSHHTSWNSILNTCKSFNNIGREIFDHSVNSRKYILRTIKNKNYDALKYLIDNNKIEISKEVFKKYSEFGQEECAEYDFDNDFENEMKLCMRFNRMFFNVCDNRDYKFVELLILNNRICTNHNHWGILYIMIWKEYWDIVELIIKSKRFLINTWALGRGGEKLQSLIDKYDVNYLIYKCDIFLDCL